MQSTVTLIIALVMPWVVVVALAGLVVALLRQHGRMLLEHDDLRRQQIALEEEVRDLARLRPLPDRLAAAERSIQTLMGQIDGLRRAPSPMPPAAPSLVPAPAAPALLPVGSAAPDFALPDLNGQNRGVQDYRGRPFLMIFFSLQCGFCTRMAPRLGELAQDGPRVVLISRGSVDEHRRLAEEHRWQCDVLLQRDSEVMTAYHGAGTPTGYLIDAQGKIVSPLTIGADALFALLPSAGPRPAGALLNDPVRRPTVPAVQVDPVKLAQAQIVQNGQAARAIQPESQEGLALGTRAPEFIASDMRGQSHSAREFLGRPYVLVFFDPRCSFSGQLAQRLAVHPPIPGAAQVVLVTQGSPQDHTHLPAVPSTVVVQRDWNISRIYQAMGTPTAYLIDAQGRIASPLTFGVDNVLALVAQVADAPAPQRGFGFASTPKDQR